MTEKFSCDECGACCRNIRHANFYHELDRGDGVCKNFDEATNLCTIYDERPIFCNVDAYYEKFLSRIMSRQKFYEINRAACRRLKEIDRQRDGNVTLHPVDASESSTAATRSPRIKKLTV